jgi:hypothetical protein
MAAFIPLSLRQLCTGFAQMMESLLHVRLISAHRINIHGSDGCHND